MKDIEARREKEEHERIEKGEDNGPDSEWNKRLQEKLERMKQKKMRDMSITVSQSSLGGAAGQARRSYGGGSNRNYVSGVGRIREELTKRDGVINFQTNELDGKVDICVQSIVASTKAPARISLNVTVEPTEGGDDTTTSKDAAEKEPMLGPLGMESSEVKAQMGRFERDLATLKSRVKNIISNADFNKEQAVEFHEQSVAMNRAATYWPIIHLCCIIIAGFMQATNIVSYMKQRHIV